VSQGYVYFIQARNGGPIKIGWAKDPEQRLANMQVANAEPLVIRTAVKSKPQAEKKLHERFAAKRVRGEWFEPCPEIEYLIGCCPPFLGFL
jgi:hypothetical protein